VKNMNFEALFLGPKAENRDFFKEILNFVVDEHIHWRRNFHPDDVPSITLADQRREDFIRTQQKTQEVILQLSSLLKKSSIPWHSPRYVGHMTSDILMPAHLAYMFTMLYNPNNVAWEASPETTRLEIEVGRDLAQLMGFDRETAFGHITSGGSLANVEALWIARNLKSVPLAIREIQPELVAGLSERELQHLSPARVLGLVDVLKERMTEIKERSVRGRGLKPFQLGKIFLPETKHYSWVKAADLLGIGLENVVQVRVEENYRMDMTDLEMKLQQTVDAGDPILAVVGVVGTTEEAAVDPIDKIIELRSEFEKQGVSFYIHVDAAYGGYARSVFLNEESQFLPYEELLDTLDEKSIITKNFGWPSTQVYNAFKAVAEVDSVTVDPHKLGYIPYQAGAVVFRDRRARQLISYFAPYVFSEDDADSNSLLLGSYIVEGSKAGAAAAAAWTAHQVLGLNVEGYGKIIGEGIEGAQRFYQHICEEPLIRVGDRSFRIAALTEPDMNIIVYALNEESNNSLEQMNDLNRRIKEKLCFSPNKSVYVYDFMVSSTTLEHAEYGDQPQKFLDKFGIPESEWEASHEVFVMRSTIMSPYLTEDFTDVDYLGQFFQNLEKLLQEIIKEE